MKKISEIKGDASFRKFYRKKNNRSTSIVVFAKREKFKNLLVYFSINKILNKNKILAPILYSQNYSKNYIEIQDFGKKTIFNILKKKKNKFFYFKKIVSLLNQIQSIKNRRIRNFRKKNYIIPRYEKKILIDEANLFCKWYVDKNLSKFIKKIFSKKFKMLIQRLTRDLKLKNDVFVHRDFHVSNLMWVKNQIGVIDSQDALIETKHDLALIDDVRFKSSLSLKNKVFNFYVKKQKN